MNIINKTILSELESHVSHDKFIRNVRTFIEYLPAQIREIDILLRSGDLKAVTEKAHTLKGTCGQFGAMRLHEIFKTIEASAGSARVLDVQMMIRALPYEFQLVQEMISLAYMPAETESADARVAAAVPASMTPPAV